MPHPILTYAPPVPVTAVRDGWDWVGVAAGLAGAILATIAVIFAALAIHRGNVIAREAHEEIIRERWNIFELGILARVVEACGEHFQGSLFVVQGLLEILPAQDLPGIRAAVRQGRLLQTPELETLYPEYAAAVNRRLNDGRATLPAGRP
jgi:hypothetical protein